MKRLLILITIVFMLSGCASSATVPERSADIEKENTAEEENGLFTVTIETDEVSPAEREETVERAFLPGTSGDLSFEDFEDLLTFVYEGIPEEAYFPIVRYAHGEWKYELRFQYDSSDGYLFDEIGLADFIIDEEKDAATIVLHPRLANDGYEVWEESDEDVGYKPFESLFDESGLFKLVGNDAVIVLDNYFSYEGREYIMGEMWLSEETFGSFWMYRGQE